MDRTMLTRDLIEATTLGASTLINPQRLTRRTRPAYRLFVAASSGAVTYRGLSEDPEELLTPASRAAVALGAAGTVFGTMGLWERVDARTHQWLVARGVKHPRLVLAGAAFVTSLVPALLARRQAASGSESLFELDDVAPRREELDPRLRAVLRAILGHSDAYGAETLRAQLADAMLEVWGEIDPTEPMPEFVEIVLRDPAAHARVVPHAYTFPVRARTLQGHEIRLGVVDGLLSHVVIDWAPGHPQDTDEWPTAWPPLDDITLVTDEDAAVELS